jgi:hypothetical protein
MILAVDPGLVSGVFAVYNDGSIASALELSPYETVSFVEAKALISPRLHVVCEQFTFAANAHRMTRQPEALEIIGALRYVSRKHSRPFKLQSRNIKSRVDNDTLKRIGWYSQTVGGHLNDAARHAFVAFVQLYPHHSLVKTSLATI